MRKVLYTLMFVTICYASEAQTDIVFRANPIQDPDKKMMNEVTSSYNGTLYKLDVRNFTRYVKQQGPATSFVLELGNALKWKIRLFENDMKGKDHQLLIAGDEGIKAYPKEHEVNTYKGYLVDHPGSTVRFFVKDNYVSGMIMEKDQTYYIDPMINFDKSADKNHLLLYTLNQYPLENICSEIGNQTENLKPESQRSDDVILSGECVNVEVAVAVTSDFYNAMGQQGSQDFVDRILNLVDAKYQELDVQLTLVTTFISTSTAQDPVSSSTDGVTLLTQFSNWGIGGGFKIDYDVATMWTERDFGGAEIGRAWVNGICGHSSASTSAHHIVEHFKLCGGYCPDGLMAYDQAHEMAHNWGANHLGCSNCIMGTRINANTNMSNTVWDQTTINIINNTKSSKGCFSSCSNEPAANFTTDVNSGCGSLKVQFTDLSANATTWLWNFGDGNTSTEKDPVHTYSTLGTYTVTLRASNEFGENQIEKTDLITVGAGAPFQAVNGAAPDTAMGGGGFNPTERGLIFNALEDIIIDKVTVYASQAGNMPVSIKANGQSAVFSKTIPVNVGKNVVNLGAEVAQGNNYLIQSTGSSLYRNNKGVSFPYSVDNLVTITNSNATATPENFYYFFYDWNVRKKGCLTTTVVEHAVKDVFMIYPNPASGKVFIEFPDMDHQKIVEVYDLVGQRIQVIIINHQENKSFIDLSGLEPGTYIMKARLGQREIYKKLIKL